jgi:hypothetical protein
LLLTGPDIAAVATEFQRRHRRPNSAPKAQP